MYEGAMGKQADNGDLHAKVAGHEVQLRSLASIVDALGMKVQAGFDRVFERMDRSDAENAARMERFTRDSRPNLYAILGSSTAVITLLGMFFGMVYTLQQRTHEAVQSHNEQKFTELATGLNTLSGDWKDAVRLIRDEKREMDVHLQQEMDDNDQILDAKRAAQRELLEAKTEHVKELGEVRDAANRRESELMIRLAEQASEANKSLFTMIQQYNNQQFADHKQYVDEVNSTVARLDELIRGAAKKEP